MKKKNGSRTQSVHQQLVGTLSTKGCSGYPGHAQGIDLCLNEGDEVVECDLIIICDHEKAVGRIRKIG